LDVLELNLKLTCEVDASQIFSVQEMASFIDEDGKEALCNKLVEILIVQDGKIIIDPTQQPLSELMSEMRQTQFD